jgi:predicted TIM-barrel enzyme
MPAMTRFSPPSLAMAVGISQPVAPKLAIQARLPVGVNMLRNPLCQFAVPGVVISRVTGKDGSRYVPVT